MRQTLYCCAFALAGLGSIAAQGDPGDGKLLTTFQNPVGNLISVPFQNNVNFPIGQFSRVQDVLNIQPVIPINLNEDWLLISRWITPVVYQPNILNPSGGATGLGDLNPSFFLSPAKPGKVIWGIGPTVLLPTATDHTLGQGRWGAGPSFVMLLQPEHWTIGFLSNNIWSIGGDRQRPLVNQFLTQYFINYNMKKGWFLTESPILTSNWMAPPHDRWTVPFGAGIGKISKVGSQPFVWQVNLYYNLIHPQDIPVPSGKCGCRWLCYSRKRSDTAPLSARVIYRRAASLESKRVFSKPRQVLIHQTMQEPVASRSLIASRPVRFA